MPNEERRTDRRGLALDLAAAALCVGLAAGAGRLLGANAATMALVLFTVVLFLAALRGATAGVVASLLATACFNFFFLPPLHAWSVAEPQNWVALGCFLVASILAGRLLARVRREAAAARARGAEIEALYRLSVDLFRTASRAGELGASAERAFAATGATSGGLVLFEGSPFRQRIVWWQGARESGLEDLAAGLARHRRTLELPAASGRDVYLPLLADGQARGVLVARGTAAATPALESVGALLAIAVERERLFREQSQLAALHDSDALKTALLRAVSHDLTTPLTAITLQTGQLRRRASADTLPLVQSLEEEADRLRRRVESLLAMARLDAGALRPSREPTPPADLFRAAREHLSLVARSRPIVPCVEADCPDLDVDPSLALEIVVNLIENAHRASPAGAPIELVARRHPSAPQRVRLEIADQGTGVPRLGAQAAASADGPDAEDAGRGLGLEIAQSLARAMHGEVTLDDRAGGGAVAVVDLPAAGVPAAVET